MSAVLVYCKWTLNQDDDDDDDDSQVRLAGCENFIGEFIFNAFVSLDQFAESCTDDTVQIKH